MILTRALAFFIDVTTMSESCGQAIGATCAIPNAMSVFVNNICDQIGLPRSIILDVAIVWNTLVLSCLLICACVMATAAKYFTDPPAKGQGLDTLWSVDQGDSFSIIVPPTVMIITNFIAVRSPHTLLLPAPQPTTSQPHDASPNLGSPLVPPVSAQLKLSSLPPLTSLPPSLGALSAQLIFINCGMCNQHVYGCFHGVSAIFVVQLFVYMAEWGSQAVMLTDLNKDTELGTKVNSPTGMATITKSSIQTAQALVVFSAAMLVFQTVLTILLGFFKEPVCEEAGLCGENACNASKASDTGRVPDAFDNGFVSADNL